jgi:hypothetical protein
MTKQTNRLLIFVGIAAICVVLSLSITRRPRMNIPTSNSVSKPQHALASSNYTTTKSAAGADSLDNLAQMDDCIRRSDQACETAMLLDGRAFLVEKGTMIDGQEIGYGVFEGTARSGILVGKEIYIPVGAFK